MVKIYRKKIKNKGFYYLTEQIRFGKKYKKIQVYLGKNIPKDLSVFYAKLAKKEERMLLEKMTHSFRLGKEMEWGQVEKIEKAKLKQKYFFAQLSDLKSKIFWRQFAIEFIFQSNAIEGSKLSQDEVEKIINQKYIKKSLNQKEVVEVQNSLRAFNLIRSDEFKLNQKNIKKLHQIVTENLDIEQGYKKKKIIVNNKDTVLPEMVKNSLQKLIVDYKRTKKIKHPFFSAIDFHSDFEFIHPFTDGNGRVGRMLLIWMLYQNNYGMILFNLRNRQKYFTSLDYADKGRHKKLYWFAARAYEKTMDFLKK